METELDLLVKNIVPVVATKKKLVQDKLANVTQSNWDGLPQDNIFEETVIEAINELGNELSIPVSPSFMHSSEAYDFHRNKPLNITRDRYSAANRDMYYGFYNDEKVGCHVFAKVVDPRLDGKGIHVGTLYYNPYRGSKFIESEAKTRDSHFRTNTIVRASTWKDRTKKTIKEGMTQCLAEYGTGSPTRPPKPTVQQVKTEGELFYASPGSLYNGMCLTKQQWQRDKKTCMNIGIKNFGNSGKNAFVLLPYNEYKDFREGDTVEYDPNDMECTDSGKAFNCTLKPNRKIKLA